MHMATLLIKEFGSLYTGGKHTGRRMGGAQEGSAARVTLRAEGGAGGGVARSAVAQA
eukprot:CAMPEP_0119386844 /NCGR_PEP_ID=MMETSP1334-20130426/97960_1 /TAXON_ID=127549 /ORGANISM="Calcidiscus leptoporus, Strain RCC1130" /LENGTH=56 /DNA_ID=CAMNT_0007408435 /DNA_START=241 /DNA_END=408 /DNA_ORIENTATION=+